MSVVAARGSDFKCKRRLADLSRSEEPNNREFLKRLLDLGRRGAVNYPRKSTVQWTNCKVKNMSPRQWRVSEAGP